MKRSKTITLVLIASMTMTAQAAESVDLSKKLDNASSSIIQLGQPDYSPSIANHDDSNNNGSLWLYLFYWHLLTSENHSVNKPVTHQQTVKPSAELAKSPMKPITRGGFGKSASTKFSHSVGA